MQKSSSDIQMTLESEQIEKVNMHGEGVLPGREGFQVPLMRPGPLSSYTHTLDISLALHFQLKGKTLARSHGACTLENYPFPVSKKYQQLGVLIHVKRN